METCGTLRRNVPGSFLETVGIDITTTACLVELHRNGVCVVRVGQAGASIRQGRLEGGQVIASVLARLLPKVLHDLLAAACGPRSMPLRQTTQRDPGLVRKEAAIVVTHTLCESRPQEVVVVVCGVEDFVFHPCRTALYERIVRPVGTVESPIAELNRVI